MRWCRAQIILLRSYCYGMKILGIASESHDAGVALLRDGRPVIVLEEERLNREKHTSAFPRSALAELCKDGKRLLEDIDVITTPWDMRRLRWTFLKAVFGHPPSELQPAPTRSRHDQQYLTCRAELFPPSRLASAIP